MIAARLDGDRVVKRLDVAIFDQHVLTAIGVNAIVVEIIAIDFEPPGGDVLAKREMNIPARAVLNRYAFDQDILAFVEVHEQGPQVMHLAIAEAVVFAVAVLIKKTVAENAVLVGGNGFRPGHEGRSCRALVACAIRWTIACPCHQWCLCQ